MISAVLSENPDDDITFTKFGVGSSSDIPQIAYIILNLAVKQF